MTEERHVTWNQYPDLWKLAQDADLLPELDLKRDKGVRSFEANIAQGFNLDA